MDSADMFLSWWTEFVVCRYNCHALEGEVGAFVEGCWSFETRQHVVMRRPCGWVKIRGLVFFTTVRSVGLTTVSISLNWISVIGHSLIDIVNFLILKIVSHLAVDALSQFYGFVGVFSVDPDTTQDLHFRTKWLRHTSVGFEAREKVTLRKGDK